MEFSCGIKRFIAAMLTLMENLVLWETDIHLWVLLHTTKQNEIGITEGIKRLVAAKMIMVTEGVSNQKGMVTAKNKKPSITMYNCKVCGNDPKTKGLYNNLDPVQLRLHLNTLEHKISYLHSLGLGTVDRVATVENRPVVSR